MRNPYFPFNTIRPLGQLVEFIMMDGVGLQMSMTFVTGGFTKIIQDHFLMGFGQPELLACDGDGILEFESAVKNQYLIFIYIPLNKQFIVTSIKERKVVKAIRSSSLVASQLKRR